MPLLAEREDRLQAVIVVALDADDRVKQAVDDEAAGGDRHRHRIDEEGHVVVDDSDAHPAVADLPADGFEADQRDARRAALGASSDEAGSLAPVLVSEILYFAWEGAFGEQALEVGKVGHVSGFFRYHAVRVHNFGSQPTRQKEPPAFSAAICADSRGGARLVWGGWR
jgi:hypothetical protein